MKQLIYVSKPVNEVDPQMISNILEVSDHMNFDNGISGMLVCDGEYFLQVIEGDDTAVDQLYSNICKDNRHYDIKLIGSTDIDKKDFKEWGMGYVHRKKDIIDTIRELTLENNFNPYQFTYLEAKSVLIRLSSHL